jgi:hypothetical protein
MVQFEINPTRKKTLSKIHGVRRITPQADPMKEGLFHPLFSSNCQVVHPLGMTLAAGTNGARPTRKSKVVLHEVLWARL